MIGKKENICVKEGKSYTGDKIPGVEFKIDYTNKTQGNVRGWIDQFSLECATDLQISMIGSCFFIGAFVGSFILPRLADVVGRKPMF